MNNLKTKISIVLGIIAVLLLVSGEILLSGRRITDRETEALTESMQQHAADRASSNTTLSASDGDTNMEDFSASDSIFSDISSKDVSEDTIPPKQAPVENPYQDSFLANKDMAAWLKIEDTRIDYPVMWTPGDETYYLYRDFSGQKDQNGCLLLDTDSSLDPLTTNLIIHGHNMKNGGMFGTLTSYEDPDYCQKHNIISLYTKDCQRRYEVIAVFRSQVYRKTDSVFKFYKFFQADTEEEFEDFYQNIQKLSLYDTGVTAEFGDHFLTLSTCVYHVEQGRFVVVAKEIDSGDSYTDFYKQTSATESDNIN